MRSCVYSCFSVLRRRELKEELEARGEVKSGNKAWLRRRLHAAILRVRLRAVRAQRKEIFGSDSCDDHDDA